VLDLTETNPTRCGLALLYLAIAAVLFLASWLLGRRR
jgi:hypothetical protein